MAERLDYIRLEPTRVLDIGCGTGADLAALAGRYPAAEIIAADSAFAALHRARPARSLLSRVNPFSRGGGPLLTCADIEKLPFPAAAMTLVWSNLMLNWLDDPLAGLREMARVLEVGGMVMFSTLVRIPQGLRSSFPKEDGDRVHRFIDMHDLGDALIKAGFGDPVMDMQMITLTYSDLDGLLRDLRLSGAASAARAVPPDLPGGAPGNRYGNATRPCVATVACPQPSKWCSATPGRFRPTPRPTARSVIQFRPRDDFEAEPAMSRQPVWLFDLDNTLHDASRRSFRTSIAA